MISLQPGDKTTDIPCLLCGDNIDKKVMRKDIGIHTLKDGLGMVCGFCGSNSCSISLERGSGRGKTVTLVPGSNCAYREKFSIKANVPQQKVVHVPIGQLTVNFAIPFSGAITFQNITKTSIVTTLFPLRLLTVEERKLLGL